MEELREREQTKAISIVIVWKESVESYARAGREIRVEKPKTCPDCRGSHLIFWSGYPRYVTSSTGEFRVFIRRVLCRGCGKTHGLIPWFLLARRHHTVDIIGHALWLKIMERKSYRALSRMMGIPLTTLRGWIKRFCLRAKTHYRRLLFLINISGANAPPLPPCNYPEGSLLILKMLFAETSLKDEPNLFWPYVSLLIQGELVHQHSFAL